MSSVHCEPARGQPSFTVALNTARDQIIHAARVITGTTINLVGKIGCAVLASPLPPHRAHVSPRVVNAPSPNTALEARNGSRRVFVDHTMLDRYGFGDASSLAERVVFFTRPDDDGWVRLLPVQRRADYADGSAAAGWLHPAGAVTDDQDCPCGPAEPYSACHGATIPAGDPFDRIRVYDADNHLILSRRSPSAPVGYEQAQHVDRESSRLPQPVTSGA